MFESPLTSVQGKSQLAIPQEVSGLAHEGYDHAADSTQFYDRAWVLYILES